MATKGEGRAYQWLLDHQEHDGDYCLIWPFYRNPNGYGMLGYNGDNHWAHRFMCELANGPPPTHGARSRSFMRQRGGRLCSPKASRLENKVRKIFLIAAAMVRRLDRPMVIKGD